MRSSIVALALLLLPGLAGAQLTKDQIAKAKQHFKAGQDAEKSGVYDVAITEFTAAYEITKDPKVFFKIAEVHEKAGHLEDAMVFYQRYLKEAKLSPQGEAEVEAKLAALEKRRAATETVEDKPPPETPPERPETPTETTEATEKPVVDEAPAPATRWHRTAAWVSVGLTAALLTTGGVLATSASSREEDVQRLTEYRDPITGQPREYSGTVVEQYNEAYDEGDDLDSYALIAFVGAGVTAAAAVTFFVLDAMNDGEAEEAEEPSARVTPHIFVNGAGVSAAFDF